MSGWRGIFAGVLALVALEAVVSTSDAANRTAGLFGGIAGIAEHLLNPNIALIADRRVASPVDNNPAVYTPSKPTPANRKPRPRVVSV